MNNLSLENLHLAVRYKKNVIGLVNEIYKIYDSLRDFTLIDNYNLQEFCGELFNKIRVESFDISPYLNNKKRLSELVDKVSFTSLLSGICQDKRILESLDFVSFKIVDFAHVFGNERMKADGERQFSDWKHRGFQLLFEQKGQLWLLGCLYNLLELEKQNSRYKKENEVKSFIRQIIDKDFSPYPEGLTDEDVDKKIQKVRQLATIEEEDKECKISVAKNDRKMGFEIEHQISCSDAEKLDNEENGELALLKKLGDFYHNSGYEILKNVKVGFKTELVDVIKYGSLTRDPSNVRYRGYIACEYSSPVGNLDKLKKNVKELCELFELYGGLVREDCGTHVHISIEDLKDNALDSDNIKKQKLAALKRILRNFILLRKDFESVLPEYRRGDNSLYSGQDYISFVGGDQKFMLGLINSCKSYEELKSVLMVGGKYLALASFNNTLEFRSFPATINYEVLSNWFQLLNEFVDNSIKGIALEHCLNKKILTELQDLTEHGEKIFGMDAEDPQDLCFKCNSTNYDEFKIIQSPVVKAKIMSRDTVNNNSRVQFYKRLSEYAQEINRRIYRINYATVHDLRDCSAAMNVDRKPGEVLKSVVVPIPRVFPNSNNKLFLHGKKEEQNKNNSAIAIL